MRNTKKRIISLLALIIFIIIMTTGSILKHSFHEKDRVMYHVEQLYSDILNKKWTEAYHRLDDVQEAWKHVVRRIQFSAERNEINDFKINLERVRGFIVAKDQGGALADLAEIVFIWQELGR